VTYSTPEHSGAPTAGGNARLLAHLQLVARLTGDEGPSAYERLSARIGPEFAARLLQLLTGTGSSTSRRANTG
jgi:hypothetical protein